MLKRLLPFGKLRATGKYYQCNVGIDHMIINPHTEHKVNMHANECKTVNDTVIPNKEFLGDYILIMPGTSFNKIYSGMLFCKLLDSDMYDQNFLYKKGMNILPKEKFDPCDGYDRGLFFCSHTDIAYFWINSLVPTSLCPGHEKIAGVKIPNDAIVSVMKVCANVYKFKSNKMELIPIKIEINWKHPALKHEVRPYNVPNFSLDLIH